MATKGRALWVVLAIVAFIASSPAFASIPRSTFLDAPSIDFRDVEIVDDTSAIDNAALLHHALDTALIAPAPVESLSETRVWVARLERPLFVERSSLLSDGLQKASAASWPEIASGPTVLTPDPMGYVDSSNLYAFAGGDPVNGRDPSGELCERANASGWWDWAKRCGQDALNVAADFQQGVHDPRNAAKNIQRAAGGVKATGKLVVGTVAGVATLAWDVTTMSVNDAAADRMVARGQGVAEFAADPVGKVVNAHTAAGDAILAAEQRGDYVSSGDSAAAIAQADFLAASGAYALGRAAVTRLASRAAPAATAPGTPWSQISSDYRAIVRDVESHTHRAIPRTQRSQLSDQIRRTDHREAVQDQAYRQLQSEYRENRSLMIQAWETNTGQIWPQGAQAHHLIPMRYGGPNQWWNITPAYRSAHQPGIHGSGSPTQRVFPTPVPRRR